MKALAFIFIALLAISSHCSSGANEDNSSSGNNQLNGTGPFTVHLIPHTHDDIGWLKTVDEYLYDSNKDVTIQGVQYILDTVYPFLMEDVTKKFIYVEIGFFKRWWDQQDNTTQTVIKGLVNSSQFEFINGGWCMNDEAAVYYEDSIDQMALGHKFILDNFNTTPSVGWHIDPFGHAAAQAALFAQMGFDGFFFSRIDYQDQGIRTTTQAMETLWIPQTSQGIENAILTQINYNGYGFPPGYCFDFICGDDPIMDDPVLTGYNIDAKAIGLVNYFAGMNTSYLTNTFMHTAGGDFNWMSAGMNWKNYDKLLAYINKQPSYNMTIQYSTPSEYLNATFQSGQTYPIKTDDFFPYADSGDSYWTGYFTSRVSLKGLVREKGQLLQAVRRLATQAAWSKSSSFVLNNFNQIDTAINQLEEAMGVNQHHDAVSGTSKQAVAEDYKWYLSSASDAVTQNFLIPYFQERAQNDLNISNLAYQSCQLNASASLCDVTYSNLQSESVLLTVYNSGPGRYTSLKVKVPSGAVQVLKTDGLYLTTDVICANLTDKTDCVLVFSDYFNGYGLAHYYLKPILGSNRVDPQSLAGTFGPVSYDINSNQTLIINNLTSYNLTLCKDSSRKVCTTTPFTLTYNYYKGYGSGNDQSSGAYIFRPNDTTQNASIPYDLPISANVYKGKSHLHIRLYGARITTDIRVYRDLEAGIEVQTFVDSIAIADGVGKEVVLTVQVPGIQNNGTFYTDSMGMELQQRVVNYRPSWKLNVTQPAAGNYYPIQSTILINDTTSGQSLAVIPDRAQGGASIQNGTVELMIHRRLLFDDWRGVGEPLNETDSDGQGMRQWVTHVLLFNTNGYNKTTHRDIQHLRDTPLVSLLSNTSQTPVFGPSEQNVLGDSFSDLDPEVKIVTRPISLNKFLFRFQNMNEVVNKTVATSFFKSSQLGTATVVETSLTANQAKSTMILGRLNWNKLGLNNPALINTDYLTSNSLTLRPLELRTFIVTFGSKSSDVADIVETDVDGDDEVIMI